MSNPDRERPKKESTTMMTTNERIKRHGEQLLAIFPNASKRDPMELCRQLRRIENEAHRLAESLCSEEWLDHDAQCAQNRVLLKAQRLLGDTEGRVWLNGDPRGYALKIDLRDCPSCDGNGKRVATQNCPRCDRTGRERLHTDWGGYGIVAPDLSD